MTHAGLQMKTYFATTVESAVDLARKELGPEAILVNSKHSSEEVRHLGKYEVVFAGTPARQFERQRAVAVHKPAAENDRQLEDIRVQLAGIRQTLWSTQDSAENVPTASEASVMRRHLEACGIESSTARDLLRAVMRVDPKPVGREELRQAILAEMESRLKVDATLGREGAAHRIVALVGPPGRGKTTTLIKLAITHGLAERVPVRILSMDNLRIAAGDQIRSYAAILGASFQALDSTAALEQVLTKPWAGEARKPGLTFIDTSGYGPGDIDAAGDLAAYFSAHPEMDTHLVLRSDAKTADVVRTVERYAHFGIAKLIFTGMDEAETFGSVFCGATQAEKPVSFLATGQRVPEDLQAATARGLVEMVRV